MPFLLLLAVMSVGISAMYVQCPGCIDRTRVNRSCEWTGDAAFPIDLQNAGHHQHLIADAQLAEELAVRYADAEFNRLYSYEAHGGLLENGRVRNECMARLTAAIETNHRVAAEQIQIARGQRNRTFDGAVVLLFVPLYLFGAAIACGFLRRRFASESRSVRFIATAMASIAASVLGLQVGQLWLGVWETVRVGNGHISTFRAATWHGHNQPVGALFVVAVSVFWFVALLSDRAAPEDEQVASAARNSAGILGR